MAHRYDRFTKAYQNSRIPFLLAEVITNGKGEMVDLVCRFINPPAAALFSSTPEAMRNQRFCSSFIPGHLERLSPLASVAFSGSCASFSYETPPGKLLHITCYQVMYGFCACILEESGDGCGETYPQGAMTLLTEGLPAGGAILEVGRSGVRILSFNQQLCDLAHCSRKEFLNRFSDHFSALVDPQIWPELLQELLDAASSGQRIDRDFRLLRLGRAPLWVNLRAQRLLQSDNSVTFQALVLDISHRMQEEKQREASAHSLADIQEQYDNLFDSLPGGYCLFRLPEDRHTIETVQISQGLSELTGYSRDELYRRLDSNLFWRVHPEDRTAYSSAFSAAILEAEPLHHLFRFEQKNGVYRWLSVSAVTRPQQDGSALIYAAYADVTQEKSAQEELQFHSELCDLLLERLGAISIDYNPAQDTADFEIYHRDGQHIFRTIPDYLHTLFRTDTVHPDYRQAVFDTLTAACSRLERRNLTYLGNYDGQGYRWYLANLVSLADSQGNVSRVILQLEDISRQRAEESWFENRQRRWEERAKAALCSVRLDLSDNRILDARSQSAHLLRVLFGNTAEECLAGMAGNIPDEAARDRFTSAFARESLMRFFQDGDTHVELEHRFLLERKTVVCARSVMDLAINPKTQRMETHGHVWEVGETSCGVLPLGGNQKVGEDTTPREE